MTVKQQILHILQNHRGKRFNQLEIYRRLTQQQEDANPQTVFRTLRRLAEIKHIKSDGKGQFWIPLEDNKSKKLTEYV